MNKKGMMIGLILALILVIVVGTIVSGAAKNWKLFLQDFKKPQISYTNDFMFTAEDIEVSDKIYDRSICVQYQFEDYPRLYTCEPKGATDFDIEFIVSINNQDSLKPLKAFYSKILICPSEPKTGRYVNIEDSCFEDILVTDTSSRCFIESGTTSKCSMISYPISLLDPGTYNIYPIAVCEKSDSGCNVGQLDEEPQSLNVNKYITITVK